MRPFLLALALIVLTQLDGDPIWLDAQQISIVKTRDGCSHGANGVVVIGQRAICVKETPDEIRKRIKDAR